ncbi:MAG: PA14 domain-containing protein [Phycisphaerales bacterium]
MKKQHFDHISRITAWAAGFVLVALAGSCAESKRTAAAYSANVRTTMALGPEGTPQSLAEATLRAYVQSTDQWATCPAHIVDTREMPNMRDVFNVPTDRVRPVREILPPHEEEDEEHEVAANVEAIPVGSMLDESRTEPLALFPGPAQTEWRPPDPTLAVGPTHIVTTVNMAAAFFNKSTGELEFALPLNDYGNPGLFEVEGGGWFTFDPKCFYDHYTQRFVIVALETYATGDPFIDIAVSDDSNPHGVWYTYRTNAAVGGAWWDYPGFGYDSQAWYVTGNLIGGGGVGFRIFNKTPMLTGQPAQFATLTTGAGTVQVAQMFGSNPQGVPYFASLGSSAIVVHAIRNPLTTPTLVSSSVPVAAWTGGPGAPTPTDTLGNLTDRAINACWRNGFLYTTHAVNSGGRSAARWYQIATNSWPTSGTPTLVQSGTVDAGTNLHVTFPSIYANSVNDVAMTMNICGPTMNPGMAVTGRRASDPAGTMGAVRVVHNGTIGEAGRWGDYTDLAVDPVDDLTFWGIAEYKESDGWKNWIASFAVTPPTSPIAAIDDAGNLTTGQSRAISVLNNDYFPPGFTPTLATFDTTSTLGGTITRNGNVLTYTAPASVADSINPNSDTFHYTISAGSTTAQGTVRADVFDPITFRWPGNPITSTGPLAVRYYELTNATSFPNFISLTPYQTTTATSISIAQTEANVASSGRSDNVGIVYEGWVNVTTAGVFAFRLAANEGAKLYLNGRLEIDNSGPNSSDIERLRFIGLRTGFHHLRVEYYEHENRASLSLTVPLTLVGGVGCDSLDFNGDGSIFDPMDIDAFLSVYSEGPCIPATAQCADVDFNNDESLFDPMDIDAFFSVFSEGPCVR